MDITVKPCHELGFNNTQDFYVYGPCNHALTPNEEEQALTKRPCHVLNYCPVCGGRIEVKKWIEAVPGSDPNARSTPIEIWRAHHPQEKKPTSSSPLPIQGAPLVEKKELPAPKPKEQVVLEIQSSEVSAKVQAHGSPSMEQFETIVIALLLISFLGTILNLTMGYEAGAL